MSYDISFSLLALCKCFKYSLIVGKCIELQILFLFIYLLWLVDGYYTRWSSCFKQMDFLSVNIEYNCASALDFEEELHNLQVNIMLVFYF